MRARGGWRAALRAGLVAASLAGAACAPVVIPAGPPRLAPALSEDAVVAADGAILPLRRFAPPAGVPPRAVVLALHGFNDHAGNFLADSIGQLTAAGLLVYAYDQRGFGRAPNRGFWPGAATLAADAAEAARLLRARHPDLRLVLLGESMGAAVAILAGAAGPPPPVDSYVLLAPALWSRAQMWPAMRAGLWLAGRTVPALVFGGGVGGVVASDNEAALRRLGRDPLVIRNTRVDAAIGLVGLMDAAAAALPGCCRGAGGGRVPVLLLAGARDTVIPGHATRAALNAVPGAARPRIALYAEGFHLLLSDSNREAVAADILAFVADPAAPLPSGADTAAEVWLAQDAPPAAPPPPPPPRAAATAGAPP